MVDCSRTLLLFDSKLNVGIAASVTGERCFGQRKHNDSQSVILVPHYRGPKSTLPAAEQFKIAWHKIPVFC